MVDFAALLTYNFHLLFGFTGDLMKIRPFTILLAMLAGWINRHQQDVIEYLQLENAILKSKLGKRRIILNDDQKRLLAVFGKRLGRKVLSDICCAFSRGVQKYIATLIVLKQYHLILEESSIYDKLY